MKTVARLMLGVSALAVAGCSQLPGSSLGATWTAERYLSYDHGGAGFEGALAKEYTEVARRNANKDVNWLNATAYIAKAQQAESGVAPAAWTPDQLGVNGDAASMYQTVVNTVAANKAARPEACARAQVMWDQYLEALRGGPNHCITPDEARALLDEALARCAGGAVDTDFIVYFGFDRTDLTTRAQEVVASAADAIAGTNASAVSVVGHADTVGSVGYNQGLSERRARRVADGLVQRGVNPGILAVAGRSELEPARVTGDNVREPLNRRVEIGISQ